VDEYGATRERRRPAHTGALAAVGASVVAVLATLTIPHVLSAQGSGGPTVPQRPTPVHTPDAPGTRTWQQVLCGPRAPDGCAAPTSIDHAGLLLQSIGGRRVVWRDEPGAAAALEMKVPRSKALRWVLVGGRYTVGAAHLVVVIGSGPPMAVPPDRLSLFALREHGPVTVKVTDFGTPFDGEVLRIEEYVPR
jgi:hypothetical protein